MNKLNNKKTKLPRSALRLLPYALLGAFIFSWNSNSDFNYIFRSYFVLLEAQAGILVIYWLMSKLGRISQRKDDEHSVGWQE
jgi:hypothetical protein